MRLIRNPVTGWTATLIVVSIFGWGGYKLGRGSDSTLALWTARASEASTHARLPGKTRSQSGQEAVRRLLREDPSQWDQARQLEAWEQVRGFSIEQIKAGLQITGEALDDNNRNVPATMLFYRWGQLDPQEAMRHVRQLAGAYRFGDAILSAWVKNDPDAAYRWSLGEREFAQQLNIGRMLAATLMAESPASAVAKSLLMDGEVSRQYTLNLAMTMASAPASRAEFLSAISQLGEKERQDAVAVMIRVWSRNSPEELLSAWETLPIAAEQRSPLLMDVVGIWGRKDPAKAIAWVGAHPKEAGASKQTDIYRNWLSTDAAAAGQWLTAQSDPTEIATELVHQLYSRSLQDTMGHIWWKERQQERDSLRQHYRIWAESKPDEAAQWLESIDPASAKSITAETNETH